MRWKLLASFRGRYPTFEMRQPEIDEVNRRSWVSLHISLVTDLRQISGHIELRAIFPAVAAHA